MTAPALTTAELRKAAGRIPPRVPLADSALTPLEEAQRFARRLRGASHSSMRRLHRPAVRGQQDPAQRVPPRRALRRRPTCLVWGAGVQSNNCRQTAAGVRQARPGVPPLSSPAPPTTTTSRATCCSITSWGQGRNRRRPIGRSSTSCSRAGRRSCVAPAGGPMSGIASRGRPIAAVSYAPVPGRDPGADAAAGRRSRTAVYAAAACRAPSSPTRRRCPSAPPATAGSRCSSRAPASPRARTSTSSSRPSGCSPAGSSPTCARYPKLVGGLDEAVRPNGARVLRGGARLRRAPRPAAPQRRVGPRHRRGRPSWPSSPRPPTATSTSAWPTSSRASPRQTGIDVHAGHRGVATPSRTATSTARASPSAATASRSTRGCTSGTTPTATVVRAAREANAAMPEYAVDAARGRLRRPRPARGSLVLGAGVPRRGQGDGVLRRLPAWSRRCRPAAPRRWCTTRCTPTRSSASSASSAYHLGEPVDAAIVQADHAEYRDLEPASLPGLKAIVDGRQVTDPARFQGVTHRVIGLAQR